MMPPELFVFLGMIAAVALGSSVVGGLVVGLILSWTRKS